MLLKTQKAVEGNGVNPLDGTVFLDTASAFVEGFLHLLAGEGGWGRGRYLNTVAPMIPPHPPLHRERLATHQLLSLPELRQTLLRP